MQDTNVQTESTTNSRINPLFENPELELKLSYSDTYLKKFSLTIDKLEYKIFRSIEIQKNLIGERYKFTNSSFDINLFKRNYNVINILQELYDILRYFKKIRIYQLIETTITYLHNIDWVEVNRNHEFIDQSDSEIKRLEINLLRRLSRIFVFMFGPSCRYMDNIILCTKVFSSLKMFDEFKNEYNKRNNIEEIQISDIIEKTNTNLSCVANIIYGYIQQNDSFLDKIIETIIMKNELFFNSSKDSFLINIEIKKDLLTIFGIEDIYFERNIQYKDFYRKKNFDFVYDILFDNFIFKLYNRYIDHFKR